MKKIVVGKFLANGEFDFKNPNSQDEKAHQKRHVGGLKKEQMSTKEIESYLHS